MLMLQNKDGQVLWMRALVVISGNEDPSQDLSSHVLEAQSVMSLRLKL